LAPASTDRDVRPFEWRLEWIPQNGQPHQDPGDTLRAWVSHVMSDTDAFFTPATTSDYHFEPAVDGRGLLTFPSALVTPHPDNNTVRCRFFPARHERVGAGPHEFKKSPAVLVMPQWNADPDGHVGLCRLLAWNG